MTLTSSNSILPDYSNTGDIALKNQKTLRRLVGSLGICLPFFVYIFLQITNNFDPILPSISHYYFTRSSSLLEIIVSLLAVFLLIYKGEEFIDYFLSSLAGISALLMLLFPTGNLKGYLKGIKYDKVAVTSFDESNFRPILHYCCATIFLMSLALMALFLFTKSSPGKSKTKQKKARNVIYRVCGIIMLMALVTAFLGFKGIIHENFYDSHNLTFWMEVVAVEAFGIAWMIKGEVLLPDK